MQAILTFALLMPSFLQELPDAAALMKQPAGQKYQTLQYVGESSTEMLSGPLAGRRMTSEVSAYVKNPGKSRLETKAQGQSSITIVSDGEFIWTYNSSAKQYTKVAAAMGMMGVLSSMTSMDMSSALAGAKTSQRTLREDRVEVDGRARPCWMVEIRIEKMTLAAPQNASGDGIGTHCIDKELGISLQSSMAVAVAMADVNVSIQTEQKTQLRSLKIDAPLDDSIFTFVPPSDAREVTAFSTPGLRRPDLSGTSAPSFDVKALDGASFSLASLKGRPVLLDFWASWCEPCRKAMPALENIYRDYREKGLVILGVDAGEDRQTVETFLKTVTASYPTILGIESDILASFQVTAYPTYVLIDPAGKIVANRVGYPGEAGLRSMIARTGFSHNAAPSVQRVPLDRADLPRNGTRPAINVTSPTVISKVDPKYNDAARAAKIQGTVVLAAVIDEQGVPSVTGIVRSLDPDLDTQAIAAILQWRFKPGTRNGIPVRVSLNIEVNFNLR